MSDIADFMRRQQAVDAEREYRMATERASNAMHAAKIAQQNGDAKAALRLVTEAFDQYHAALSIMLTAKPHRANRLPLTGTQHAAESPASVSRIVQHMRPHSRRTQIEQGTQHI